MPRLLCFVLSCLFLYLQLGLHSSLALLELRRPFFAFIPVARITCIDGRFSFGLLQ